MSKLDDQLREIRESQKKGRPSLHPGKSRYEHKEEEPLPDVRDMGLETEHANQLVRLAAEYAELSQVERTAAKQKALIAEQLKAICNDYSLTKVMADDLRVSYFPTSRSTIDKGRLLACGIPAQTITTCTVTTTTMSLRVTAPNMREED